MSFSSDWRTGVPHRAQGWRVLVEAERHDEPEKLAALKTNSAGAQFTRATYELIGRLASRAGDRETAEVAGRILEQEKAAAELVAGTFERALELSLGQRPRAPLPGVTPIGKPSERDADGHQGPQDFKDVPPDEPVNQPARVETPTSQREREGETFPEPGYPVDGA